MSQDEPNESQYERLMDAAIDQALAAKHEGDVPIGAVVANADGEIIAAAHNRRIIDADSTAHAEMLAIRAAAAKIGDWRLNGCTMVVTLEPCCMCAGAIVLARIDRVVYGAADPKAGAVNTLHQLCTDPRLNHRCEIIPGVNAAVCGQLLTDFFQAQRAAGKK